MRSPLVYTSVVTHEPWSLVPIGQHDRSYRLASAGTDPACAAHAVPAGRYRVPFLLSGGYTAILLAH